MEKKNEEKSIPFSERTIEKSDRSITKHVENQEPKRPVIITRPSDNDTTKKD